ncbi:hypothetical protein B6U83_03150 [Thermoplasmatales archaeon ex4484_36]|nr:MAG: hypothetical protein B6U83_03150 [Thermoplasmatales archaeon ex4484_36]
MVEFKAVIGDPKTGKTYQKTVTGQYANRLLGMKIGDVFDGIFVSLPGYTEIVQINMKVVSHGARPIEELLKEEEKS